MNTTKLALGVGIAAMQSWEPLPNQSKINICTNLLRNRIMIIAYTLNSIMQFYKNTLICLFDVFKLILVACGWVNKRYLYLLYIYSTTCNTGQFNITNIYTLHYILLLDYWFSTFNTLVAAWMVYYNSPVVYIRWENGFKGSIIAKQHRADYTLWSTISKVL